MSSTLLRYLWLDFESTDLDPVNSRMVEVGVVGTDEQLNELFSFKSLIRPDSETYERLSANPFVIEMHSRSGLYAELVNADPLTLPTLHDVELHLLDLIAQHAGTKDPITLAGSGVSHYDKPVIDAQARELAARLTYYTLDIGTTRRAYQAASQLDIVQPLPAIEHRADGDVRDALRYARAFWNLFQGNDLRSEGNTTEERELTGIALLDSFVHHDIIRTREGEELHTVATSENITLLLEHNRYVDVAFGLMSVAQKLLNMLAPSDAEREAVLADLRLEVQQSR